VRAIIMEIVEGEVLSHRIARGALPLDQALPIAKQTADALEAAHEQGVGWTALLDCADHGPAHRSRAHSDDRRAELVRGLKRLVPVR
jgi:serine/threonine protein kinase